MQKLRLASQLVFALLLARLVLGGGDFEKWCPFGGIETLYLFFGHDTFTCSLGSSNLFVALAVILLALVARRAFCGWVCPLGAIGELFGRARDRFLPGRRYAPPEKVDRWLRLLKYPLLVLILALTAMALELVFRGFDPFYALASGHGEDITYWAYVVLGGFLVGAFFMRQPFCRYLCPLAATLDIPSRFGLLRIHRNGAACVGCKLCERVCDQGIPVAQVESVRHARCTQCLECLSVCPKGGSLFLGLPGKVEVSQ